MSKIAPFLWYGRDAEEAASLYVSLLPNSRIDHIQRSPADTPGAKEGEVMVVEFTLAGQAFVALNGGQPEPYTHALSLQIYTEDQAETDRLWDGLLAGGGAPNACGWLRDRWGVSWQVTPKRLMELMKSADRDAARRVTHAMMQMVKIDIAALEAAAAG